MMPAEKLSPITRRGLNVLAVIGLAVSSYFLGKEIIRDPIKHPDNNKFLGDGTTSMSKYGFRARISNGEGVATGLDTNRTDSKITSGEDILGASPGGFRGESGIHLKGRERFWGIPYGSPKLAVLDSEGSFVNYRLPPLNPGLGFLISNETRGVVAQVKVVEYTHPTIMLEIAYNRTVRRPEPDFKFAPVRP